MRNQHPVLHFYPVFYTNKLIYYKPSATGRAQKEKLINNNA